MSCCSKPWSFPPDLLSALRMLCSSLTFGHDQWQSPSQDFLCQCSCQDQACVANEIFCIVMPTATSCYQLGVPKPIIQTQFWSCIHNFPGRLGLQDLLFQEHICPESLFTSREAIPASEKAEDDREGFLEHSPGLLTSRWPFVTAAPHKEPSITEFS